MKKKGKVSKTESDRLFIEKVKTLTIGIAFNISDKVEKQRRDHAADIVQPHIYDKNKRKLVLNPEFIKLYPDKVRYYETPASLKKQGYTKLAAYTDSLNKASNKIRGIPEVEQEGEPTKKISKLIKPK